MPPPSNRKDFPSIRNFDAFATERRLFKSLPISTLKDKVIGIDADNFVGRTLNQNNRREPLVHAIGGFPIAINQAIDTLVESLKTAGAKPLFVLRGLKLQSIDEPFSDSKLLQRSQAAWAQYEKGEGEEAVKSFDDSPVELEPASRELIKLLCDKKLEFMVAAFTSSAQLAYLLQHEYIDAVYGSSDALMYNVDKLITSMDPRNGTFYWLKKAWVLNELGFSHQQFVEAAIAAGCELNKVTFNPVEQMISAQPIAPVTALKAIQDITHAHMSMYAAILSHPDAETPAFAERFRRALAAAQFQPVLKDDGHVGPLNSEDVPNDIHEFIGQRLPDEIMFYFSRGLIGPEFLNSLSTGVYLEHAPLDGGDCKEYRKLVEALQPLRNKAMNYLTQTMHRYYQFKLPSYTLWYNTSAAKPFDKVNPPIYQQVKWKVSGLKQKTSGFADVVGSLKDLAFVERSLDMQPAELETDLDIMSNTIYRFLETEGFVNKDHELSPWGKVLDAALSAKPQLGEEIVALVGLFKHGFLHGDKLTPEYSGGPIRGDETQQGYTRLLSRVASAVNLKHKPVGYTGPLSRNVLAYHSFITTQMRAYRQLIENVLVSLLANGNVDRLSRSEQDWNSLVAKIPFAQPPNNATGIAMKSFLDECILSDSQRAKGKMPGLFKQAVQVEKDVSRAFDLWDALMVGVSKAKSLGLVKDIDQFEKANEFIKDKRF